MFMKIILTKVLNVLILRNKCRLIPFKYILKQNKTKRETRKSVHTMFWKALSQKFTHFTKYNAFPTKDSQSENKHYVLYLDPQSLTCSV